MDWMGLPKLMLPEVARLKAGDSASRRLTTLRQCEQEVWCRAQERVGSADVIS